MEVAYIETIKGLVKAGLGISILPDKAVEQEILGGVLVKSKIQDATFSRNSLFISRTNFSHVLLLNSEFLEKVKKLRVFRLRTKG
jgi:DNA-binding transcriptional LysR family regulator